MRINFFLFPSKIEDRFSNKLKGRFVNYGSKGGYLDRVYLIQFSFALKTQNNLKIRTQVEI